jgi:serine/threonine protein kinase
MMMNNNKNDLIIVGDYQINTRQKIGNGGFGTVFLSFHTKSLTTVAVKQISLVNKDSNKIKEIQNEIKLLKHLDHKRIVRYKDHGELTTHLGTHLYIMMEYLESGSLGALTRKFKIDESGISKYIAHVLEGLAFLHSEGIIHRDIKGDNVLLTKDGDVKLADFGVSAKLARVTRNEVVGTPYWMAPEVISLSGSTYASDIWSVGCMVIELLTGKPPYYDFERQNAFFKIVMDPHPPIPTGISGAAQDFLMSCFHKEPGLRKTAAQLMKHPWIVQTDSPVKSIQPTIRVSSPNGSGNRTPSSRVVTRSTTFESFSSSSGSWKSDTWDTFGNGYETVIQQKKESVKKAVVPVSKTDKLLEYHESDSDSDELDSWNSTDTSDLDLEKRLKLNMKTHSPADSDEDLFHGVYDLEINEAQKLEDDALTIIRTIEFDMEDSELLQIISELQQRADDDYVVPTIAKAFLNDSMISIVTLLAQKNSLDIVLALLKLTNTLSHTSEQIKDHLLLIGIFPAIMKLLSTWTEHNEMQHEVVCLLYTLMQHNILCTKTFVAAGGLPLLVNLLKQKDFQKEQSVRQTVYRTVDVILEIFNHCKKSDICRLFAAQKLPLYLSESIKDMVHVLNNNELPSQFADYIAESTDSVDSYFGTVELRQPVVSATASASEYIDKSVGIMVNLSVRADVGIVNPGTITNILSILEGLDSKHKLATLHFITNVSSITDPSLQEILINCGVLQALVRELSIVLKEKNLRDTEQIPCKSCVHILNALYMLCCYNNQRKEIIAREGAISLLKDILVADLPMQNFALDLFLGFSISTNPETRKEFMVKQGGLLGLFCILRTMNTRAVWPQMVLEALCELLNNNSSDVQQEYEQMIAHPDHAQLLIELFTNNNEDQAPWALQMIPSLAHLLQLSHLLADTFAACDKFIVTLALWLSKEVEADKADPIKLKSLFDVLRLCLHQKADASGNIPVIRVPSEAQQAINDLIEYTEQRKLALAPIVQDLQKHIV